MGEGWEGRAHVRAWVADRPILWHIPPEMIEGWASQTQDSLSLTPAEDAD